MRLVRRWINNTLPIKSRIQEIWTATATTPAKSQSPQAINPTAKNTSARSTTYRTRFLACGRLVKGSLRLCVPVLAQCNRKAPALMQS